MANDKYVLEYDPEVHSPYKAAELKRRRLAGHENEEEGLGCTFSSKIVHPLYFEAETDLTITNNLNSWIVLGRDRPGNYQSGYGGGGDITEPIKNENATCATIDLVVGRGGANPTKVDPEKKLDEIGYHPDFPSDAARVYISQRTNVDDNFVIAPGSMGSRRGKSAVAMKADNIRIMASEGIKLVTKITNYTSGDNKGNVKTLGIDLIAGNRSGGLQPMVKGNNLVKSLDEIYDLILKLTSTVAQMLRTNIDMASVLGTHTHPLVPTPPAAGPSVDLAVVNLKVLFEDLLMIFDEVTTKVNCETSRAAYLSPASGDYICSRHNNTN
jgi:hypothetical protein